MSDLVSELRELFDDDVFDNMPIGRIQSRCKRAADEIERLKAENSALTDAAIEAAEYKADLLAEIERLEAEVRSHQETESSEKARYRAALKRITKVKRHDGKSFETAVSIADTALNGEQDEREHV